MAILKFNQVSKEFSGVSLFSQVTFEINRGEKIALIGANGTGKSTIIKCMIRDLLPDSGEIHIQAQVRIGYLSQQVLEDDSLTLLDTMQEIYRPLLDLEAQLHSVAISMQNDHSEALMNRYARLEDEFLRLGGYEYAHKIDFVLSRFGFAKEDYVRRVQTFSGGEKTRIAFAKLLLEEPDLLILDEPTNHMDIEIIEWLEDYLKKYPGAVFLVTHDKYFINRVVSKIIELERGKIELYYGNFDEYEVEKVRRYEALLGRYHRQSKEIAHLQSFVDRFRYKATKAKSAQDRIKKIARIERIEKPTMSQSHVRFQFRTKRPTEAIILECNQLLFGYQKALHRPLDFAMRGFEHVGIIGPNGVGKTTFIKTVLGQLEVLSGSIVFHKELKVGYFDQNLANLVSEDTVIEAIHRRYPTKSLLDVRSILARFLFTEEDVFKSVNVLSGGEKVRLVLCLLMLEEPDFLILDEPTNHLDIQTKNIVEDVFEEFDGPMLFISHDRYFINKVATKIIHMEDQKITIYEGNYDSYKQKREEEALLLMNEKSKQPLEKKTNPIVSKAKLEAKLEMLHQEVALLEHRLFDPEIYQNKDAYQEMEILIAKKHQEMEALFEEITNASTE